MTSPALIALAGLPGTGKTTIARAIAERTGAAHLRVDTIETALARDGLIAAAGGWEAFPAAGYSVAYGVAADLLRTGVAVIADSVNPIEITREAWASVALAERARLIQVEVTCKDVATHRERVTTRRSDIPGHTVPSWSEVEDREYAPPAGPGWLHVDTSGGIDSAVATIIAALG